jgi:hypothetical protein
MLITILICFSISAIIAYFWVNAIDKMKENHPDYKGEDFLNWGESSEKQKKTIEEWDDNKFHSENEI